jgi:anti-sigma factor RsiW
MSHLNDDQLVDRLYGVSSAVSDTHLDSCPECQTRWSHMQQRRDQASIVAPPPADYFRDQRRQIYDRIARPAPRLPAVWGPATVAGIVMAAFMITRPGSTLPAPAPPPVKMAAVEAGWFEDTYSAMGVMEPRAASTIHELFAESPVPE